MKKTITTIFIISFLINFASAQIYNAQKLQEIALYEKQNSIERKERVSEFLDNSTYNKSIQFEDGTKGVLVDVIDGIPQYMATHNLQARSTTGVEYVQSEAGFNLPLFGANMTIGVWDGGLVLNTHQEFERRIKNKLGSEYSNHATHVSGTIAASGVNPDAKGMLPQVTIHSYYAFDNDLGPMAEEAANGLILSNHSYGLILGWRFNGNAWQWFGQENGKDNRFGSYTGTSRTIDNIAYNAPLYTIVWSAGNDRSDVGDGTRPPDGPFNIVGPAASAKNIITVGAITGFEEYEGPSSAEISSFSSWGPTNDGRIKPDIVADGVGLLSTASSGDTDYTTLSGTSMSAPNVTGSLGMIQEFYRQSADTFMTAAQLKSLAIHTAREAGNSDGPDYKFGWGILNTIDAIKLLQGRNNKDTVFTEATLNNGEVHEYELIPDNKTKLTATIVWTDVAGRVTELGSSTPNLVNDLDVHLEDDAGNIYYPWRMDPQNFGGSARKGVNSLDNVEKLEFFAPDVRKYKLVVSHKGELENGFQTYALALTYNSSNIENDLVYWVNGSGAYQSGSNFSNNSGGNNDSWDLDNIRSLAIDENSFDADGNLTLTQDLELDNIIFTSDHVIDLDLGGNTLTINNAIHSKGQNLRISNGKLLLMHSQDNRIFMDFDGSNNLKVELDNEGSYIIETNANVAQLDVVSGEYKFLNKSLFLEDVTLFENASVLFEQNSINLTGSLNILSENVQFAQNEWVLNEAEIISVFPLVTTDIIETTGDNSISGDLKFSKVISNSKLEIFTKLQVDSIYFNDGSNIVISDEDSLIVHQGVSFNGQGSKSISGSNADLLANLEFTFRSKLCVENLSVRNINFTSQSVLNVVSNSSVVNSENILELPCGDLIFADFKISNSCENSLIYFENISDGEIENFDWDFGNGISFDGVNNVENPVVWFEEVGEYEIKLIASNDLQTAEYVKKIIITENALSAINIVENQQGLVASVSGADYQWFRDGLPIDGETGRVLSRDLESGIYNVAYFRDSEDGCTSRVSSSFEYLVTSNTRAWDENIKLYPNPVNNRLTVKNFENYEKFRIFDFQGKIVHSADIENRSDLIDIDLNDYNSGLYFIELSGKNKSIKLKFLKK